MTETPARPRWWADVGVALVVVVLAAWWMAGSAGARTAGESAVDYSTVLKREQASVWEANHRTVSFAELASGREVIPEAIRKLNGQRVAVDGFMLPMDFEGGVRTFILNASYDMCLYGAPTIMNQRIDVAMTDGRRTVYTHTPIRVYGVLEVGEAYESGELVSIYRMKADAIYVGG